jgi:NTP pyrophosphatase (non-canonical NTP hydrolase)
MQKTLLPTHPLNLNGLGDLIVGINRANGWYDKPSEMGTRIALIHSEASELLEADRNNQWTDDPKAAQYVLGIDDDVVFKAAYTTRIKGTGEEELADILIRVLDTARYLRIDIQGHTMAKLRFNQMRGHKHGNKAY